jgi:uncharacterized damage-inducible protein DinB
MDEVKRIEDQLKRAYAGPAWHGPSVREVLANVTPEIATRRPIANAHTIWEITLHILAWQRAVLTRTDGTPVELTDLEDWPAPEGSDASAWNRLLERLDESHRQLLAMLSGLTDPELDEIVAGETYTIYFMLHGLIQHNLFHAGQIAALKKA